MNEISKNRIKLAKKNFERFKTGNVVAAFLTGSVAKGCADDNSDIDTVIVYNKPYSQKQFDKIVNQARQSGGDLFYGSSEEGFAVYYYINGIKCDFGFGDYRETEKLINEMLEKPEMDIMKHLEISGFIDSQVLNGQKWVNKWKEKVKKMNGDLSYFMVRDNLKFEPEWALNKMAVERKDILYLYEYAVLAIDRIIWILCGLNKTYYPGKLKGIEYKIAEFKIKPKNFSSRYKKIFKSFGKKSVRELYSLIRETLDLIDKHMPRQSTERIRKVLEMKLRK